MGFVIKLYKFASMRPFIRASNCRRSKAAIDGDIPLHTPVVPLILLKSVRRTLGRKHLYIMTCPFGQRTHRGFQYGRQMKGGLTRGISKTVGNYISPTVLKSIGCSHLESSGICLLMNQSITTILFNQYSQHFYLSATIHWFLVK